MRPRVRDYFEPWRAEPSRAWEPSFRAPPPVDDAEVLDRWHGARARAEEQAEWIVWGSNMLAPTACPTPAGGVAVMDDGHIICRVRPPVTDRERTVDQAAIATRIVTCVNACRGMADPGKAIDDVRGLLDDLACGRAGADDPRVLRCAGRLAGPPARRDEPEEEGWSST